MIYILIYAVVDTSAQHNCSITPLLPTTLNGFAGKLATGTKNVVIQCICTKDTVKWFDPNGQKILAQKHRNYVSGTPSSDKKGILNIPTFNDTYKGIYTCGIRNKIPREEPRATIMLIVDGWQAEFYLGFFKKHNLEFHPSVVLLTTEKKPVFYSIKAPSVGYYNTGTIDANHEVVVDLPKSVVVSSLYDDNKGIYIITSSSKVTVYGQAFVQGYIDYWNYTTHLETFVSMPVTDLCSSEYTYHAVSVNSYSLSYNSSVLIVGTEDNTTMTLTVTQSILVNVGYGVTYLSPGKEYSFVINRLQTMYIGSYDDLTGSKIVTNKQVSVFSGHQYGIITDPSSSDMFSQSSYLVEQIPPTMLWDKVYHVMPLSKVLSNYYAIKVLASNLCVIKIYCNSSSLATFTAALYEGQFVYKTFSNNQSCTVISTAEVLVAQFSLGLNGVMMTLVPSIKQYNNNFILSTFNNNTIQDYYYWYHYVNIIVTAEYYQPNMIYLVTAGYNRSLEAQKWMPMKVNNVTEAYATQTSITYGMSKIFHTNEAAMMMTIVYGSSTYGTYGTATLNSVNKGITFSSQAKSEYVINLISSNQSLSIDCKAVSIIECSTLRYEWKKAGELLNNHDSKLLIKNLRVEDEGHYQCTAFNSIGGRVSKLILVKIEASAPHITIHPIDTAAAVPFGGYFICSATGYGNMSFDWIRLFPRSSILPTKSQFTFELSLDFATSVLFIPNVTTNDTGEYYCVVWANDKASRSNVAKLHFSGNVPPPLLRMFPSSSINLSANRFNLSMKCFPEDAKFHYTWERQNDVLPSRAQGLNSSNLIIVDLKAEDAGKYRCIQSNSSGRISSEYTMLSVEVGLPEIIKHPDDVTVVVFKTATFKCTIKGYDITNVTWRKVGSSKLPQTAKQGINQSLNHFTSILNIALAAGYYSGKYYCIASNKAGKVSSNNATLFVQVPCPEMIRAPRSVTVLPGETADFYCLSLSFSGLIYEWKRLGNSKLPSSARKTYKIWKFSSIFGRITTLYHLEIKNTEPSDEGWYCCEATNECGEAATECGWLEVSTLPNVTIEPTHNRAGINTSSILTCSATGMGPLYYQWEKYNLYNNSWIRPSNRAKSVTMSKLIFREIAEEDEGIYRCVVTNSDGSVISDNATVTVYGPPNILHINHSEVSIEGNKSYLTCIATNDEDSNHPLQIQWYNSNGTQVLSDGSRIFVSPNEPNQEKSVVLFDPVNRIDSGVYTCKVFNHFESYSEANFSLNVKYPPEVLIKPSKSPLNVSVGDLLILKCTANGYPLPKVQLYKNHSLINEQPEILYYPVPTMSNHTTNYTCVGSNTIRNVTHTAEKSIIVNVQVKCSTLDDPSNGKVYTVDNKMRAIYVCDPGYKLTGTFIAECIDGQWSIDPPQCN